MIIVVGSGIAGMSAAFAAVAAGGPSGKSDVLLVSKGPLSESNTFYAQGGIAGAVLDGDTPASHIADTLAAGGGLNDLAAVEVLCEEGPDRLRELIGRGVPFDLHDGRLAGGLEAAHSFPRVLHSGGDATGAAIETTLVGAARGMDAGGLEIRESTFLADLIVEGGRVVGVVLLGPDGRVERIEAEAVILATGGAGQLYRHTTNPAGATGDGLAAAWRAGAVIGDPEFYQFHPTALAVPGNFLVSEVVRGEGAVLLDREGRRFMTALHPDAELAPRDVVARGIAATMRAQDGVPVLLDATGLGGAEGSARFLSRRFPTISRACAENGLDWARDPIPVTPAAHYWMGGIRTDVWGRSSMPGLYAAGEAACNGVHGANRLASNSLLEGLVFGHRAARAAVADRADGSRRSGKAGGRPTWEATELAGDSVPGAVPDRAELQRRMWDGAGVYRDGEELALLRKQLDAWDADTAPASDLPGLSEGSSASDGPAPGVHELETANLLTVGRIVTAAAQARLESRGAHYRADYPALSPTAHHTHLVRTTR